MTAAQVVATIAIVLLLLWVGVHIVDEVGFDGMVIMLVWFVAVLLVLFGFILCIGMLATGLWPWQEGFW